MMVGKHCNPAPESHPTIVPAIELTASTPPRTSTTTNGDTSSSMLANRATTFRLLYRGALSVPDSHLLLDGLTFAARLDSPSKYNTFSLLENPLALALESMRGRPSLRFRAVVKLSDVLIDESGGVEMDIHPNAVLSRIYFENMFCLTPFSPTTSTASKESKSEIGLKVALGDSNGPETTDIIIYGTFASLQRTHGAAKTIQLNVGRIATHPLPQKTLRLPRPDDPIPRKPPILFGRRVDGRGGVGTKDLKRVASGSFLPDAINTVKRPRLVGGGLGRLAILGSGIRLGTGGNSGVEVFKVPELPLKGKGKEKVREDVFGEVGELIRPERNKDKGKSQDMSGSPVDAVAVEKANKILIKKATIAYLAKTKDPSSKNLLLDKQHPEFKEFYGALYRGVGFALRAKMKTETVDTAVVDHLLSMHTRMYLGGSEVLDDSCTT